MQPPLSTILILLQVSIKMCPLSHIIKSGPLFFHNNSHDCPCTIEKSRNIPATAAAATAYLYKLHTIYVYVYWQRYRCDGRKHMILSYCLRVTETNTVIWTHFRYPHSGDLRHSSSNCTSPYCLHPYHGDNCMYIHFRRFVSS